MKEMPDRMITGSERRIYLRDVKGLGTESFALPDGLDQDGKIWVYVHQDGTHNCAICHEPVTDGWTRFDNGYVVCSVHVSIAGKVQ